MEHRTDYSKRERTKFSGKSSTSTDSAPDSAQGQNSVQKQKTSSVDARKNPSKTQSGAEKKKVGNEENDGSVDFIGGFRGYERLPVQTEDDLLQGCSFHALLVESSQFANVINFATRMCRLSPLDNDGEWNESIKGIQNSYVMCQTKLAQHVACLHSRYEELNDILKQEDKIKLSMEQFAAGVDTSMGEYETEKKSRRLRDELDLIASEILNVNSVPQTERLETDERQKLTEAEDDTKDILSEISQKWEVVQAILNASGTLF